MILAQTDGALGEVLFVGRFTVRKHLSRLLARGTASDLHERRVRRLLLVGSALAIATGTLWFTVFAIRGEWTTALLQTGAVFVGLVTMLLVIRDQTRTASCVLAGSVYVVLCLSSTFTDNPTAALPRSIHTFFLAAGVFSSLLFRREVPWMRHGIPLLCLMTYVVFAATHWGIVTSFQLPDAVRLHGGVVNVVLAVLLVYAGIHVVQSDVAESGGMEGELRNALARREMHLHFQPQVDADGHVFGAEALLRWKHPLRGMIAPGEFIPVAERTGLMVSIGDWVLKSACDQIAIWSERPETASLVLAVNVSASQFAQPEFVQTVLGCLDQTCIDPTRLKLELTESMLADSIEQIVSTMTALKKRGVGFSLDDFGTGFSSLSYLRRLPLDQLKIDQAFVRGMSVSGKDETIVRAIISLGSSLGFHIIAEGVETEDERQRLAGMGCTSYQGYLFSKPLTVRDFNDYVSDRRRAGRLRLKTVGGRAVQPHRAVR